MSGVSQDEADRVLRLKSREREAHACYPCRKRKVKCDGTRPCRTCQKRKHPEICTYALAHSRRRSASHHSVVRSVSPRSPANASNEPARSDAGSRNYVYSGDNSVVSILRLRASDANESMAREVGSVLGLQNTFDSYPFMDPKTSLERWKSLLTVLPQRSEVLKYVANNRYRNMANRLGSSTIIVSRPIHSIQFFATWIALNPTCVPI